jgi:NADPH:quinone reductase-like Zn-dependent oxidoreductase
VEATGAVLGPDGPVLAAQPVPNAPGDDEVLVAMERAPVNPADLLVIDGRYTFDPGERSVLGAEGCGRLIAAGRNVRTAAVGDRVILLDRGNWATRRLVASDRVVRAPDDLAAEQAAVLRINPATAWRMIQQGAAATGMRPGDWILLNGGRSMVARWVRMLAAGHNYRIIGLVRSDPAGDDLLDDDSAPEIIRNRVGAGRLMLALDCVAGAATGRLGAMLDPGGQVTVFGHLSGQPAQIPSPILTGKQLGIRGFSLRPAEQRDDQERLQRLYDDLAGLARDHRDALPEPAGLYPLSRIREAIAHARRPGAGRVQLALDA